MYEPPQLCEAGACRSCCCPTVEARALGTGVPGTPLDTHTLEPPLEAVKPEGPRALAVQSWAQAQAPRAPQAPRGPAAFAAMHNILRRLGAHVALCRHVRAEANEELVASMEGLQAIHSTFNTHRRPQQATLLYVARSPLWRSHGLARARGWKRP